MDRIKTNRLVSLDVLRGITIAGMMLVNNPGSWDEIYAPLRHAEWNGLTPTDLVFPFFMFIMGISTYISLQKTKFEYSRPILFKILKRTAIIFLIGLALSWIGLIFNTYHWTDSNEITTGERLWLSFTNFKDLRILGVMQRLALTYGAVSLISLFIKHQHLPKLIGAILIGYFLLLVFGNGFEQGDNNILAIVDQNVLGLSHMYNEFGLDPEGILSTIPSIAHVLIGFCFGKILMNVKDNKERMLQLFIYGTLLTFAGLLFSYACPINKKIWSPTYVLATCGMATTLLGLLIWIIDVKGHQKWSIFFESFGANPLFLYVFGSLLAILIDGIRLPSVEGYATLKEIIFTAMLAVGFDVYFTSCVFAILFVLVCWVVGHSLFKRKIYIKI